MWLNSFAWGCYHRLEWSDSRSGYWSAYLATSSTKVGHVMVAAPLSIARQKKDLSVLPSNTGSSGSVSGSGISANAAAGAGVAATLGVVLFLLGALWFLRRYKRNCKTSREAHMSGEANALQDMQPEVSEHTSGLIKENARMLYAPQKHKTGELDSRGRSELG